jgi:hypothetical protein
LKPDHKPGRIFKGGVGWHARIPGGGARLGRHILGKAASSVRKNEYLQWAYQA